MKRILSLLLALTLVLTMTVALTACGETSPETTVTAEEFEAAMMYSGNCSMSMKTTVGEMGTVGMTMKLAGNKVEGFQKSTYGEEEQSMTVIYEFLDDVTYMYMCESEEDGYVKTSIEMTLEELKEEMEESYMPEGLIDYDAYTYDETTKTYKAATVTFELYEQEVELKDVEIAFEDGKLMSMTYSMEQDDITSTTSLTFDYATPTVTIPTENVTDMTEGAE